MEKYLKIDLHVHSRPVSKCAQFDITEVPGRLQDAGVDGFVLVNHYYPGHLEDLGATLLERTERYIECFEQGQRVAATLGMTAVFSAEVKLIGLDAHPEFLLYGLEPSQLLSQAGSDDRHLYDMTQKELWMWCHERNILMYQAHPYRSEQGYCPADPIYMDGVEVYNGHARFDPKYEMTKGFADANGLPYSAGSDFHDPEDAGCGGILIPESKMFTDPAGLKKYLEEHPYPDVYERDA